MKALYHQHFFLIMLLSIDSGEFVLDSSPVFFEQPIKNDKHIREYTIG
jgi:hypothetical protein